MSDTPRQLFDAAAGRAGAETKRELARQLPQAGSEVNEFIRGLKRQAENALQVDWFRLLEGHLKEGAEDQHPRMGARWTTYLKAPGELLRTHRMVAAAVLVGIVLVGCTWAGWALFATPPLLEDRLNHRWLDPTKWRTARKVVKPERAYLTLINRGYLVTQKEYAQPISLSFEWLWKEYEQPDPLYAEHLSVVMRTAGDPSAENPYDIRDGILVKFNAWAQNVSICGVKDRSVEASTPLNSVPLPPDEWHQIRVTDDGENIAVYVSGPEIRRDQSATPLLEVRCKNRAPVNHIAIYNRELAGDIPHESHIRNFVIRSLSGGSDLQK